MFRFKPLKIRREISRFLILSFVCAITFMAVSVFVFFAHTNRDYVRNDAFQKISSVNQNTQNMITSLDRIVNITLINRDFQYKLTTTNNSLERGRMYSDALMGVLLQEMNITSAITFENNGSVWFERSTTQIVNIDKNVSMSDEWRDKIESANGEFAYFYDGGGAINVTSSSEPFITFVRDFTKLSDYSSLGCLALNIQSNTLETMLIPTISDEETEFIICDKEERIIVSSNDVQELNTDFKDFIESDSAFQTKGNTTFAKGSAGFSDWEVVVYSRVNVFDGIGPVLAVLLVGTVILLILLIVIVDKFFVDRVGKPIESLADQMALVIDGNFTPIHEMNKNYSSEIMNLHTAFNQMIDSINGYIKRVKVEEEAKKKSEIALIQAQIRPHFLYNALDAMSALALLGDNENAVKMSQALGGFYRTSLSQGEEFVTLKVELEGARNYITVINIRYSNRVNVHYQIDDAALDIQVLKLILQPLLENAIYHGIRDKEESGNIWIGAHVNHNSIFLSVKDDGMGMSETRIKKILYEETTVIEKDINEIDTTIKKGGGFGLRSLIKKMELWYGMKNLVSIKSELGKWTEIVVEIPIMNETE
ncbi:MAG: histidine kinase [Clostridiales Family XIII bacterium]|jgi:two-component system sensor histidine kinase YesM|nr:histidine kinase [Clostridiales Family XIII bacterium]